jgi:hypothetical protein
MHTTVDYTFIFQIILKGNFEIVYAGVHFASIHSTCSDILYKTLGYYFTAAFSVTFIFQTKRFLYGYFNTERTAFNRTCPQDFKNLKTRRSSKCNETCYELGNASLVFSV